MAVVAQLANKTLVLEKSVHRLTKVTNDLIRYGGRTQTYARLEGLLSKIWRIFSQVRAVAFSALHGNLAAEASILFDLPSAMAHVKEMAKQRGYHLLISNLNALYQCKVSFQSNNDGTVHIYIHVPIAKQDMVMKMYEFIDTPLPINNGKFFLQILEQSTILAISEDETFFQTMSKFDLIDCEKHSKTYLCSKNNVLTRGNFLTETCMGAIYKKQLPLITQHCSHKIVKSYNTISQVSDTQFVSYSVGDEFAQMKCSEKNEHNIWTESNRRFELKKGVQKLDLGQFCRLETQKHTISNVACLPSGKGQQYSSYGFNFDNPMITALNNDTEAIHLLDETPMDLAGSQNLKEWLRVTKNQVDVRQYKHHLHTFIVVVSVLSVLVFVCCFGYGWWTKHKKQQHLQNMFKTNINHPQ